MKIKSENGFTMVEMMVVMSILSVIIVAAIPLFEALIAQSKSKEEAAQVKIYSNTIRAFYLTRMHNNVAINAASVAQGNAAILPTNLLPDVTASASAEDAAVVAAQIMIDSGLVDGGQSAINFGHATFNKSRKIALYVNEPDVSGTNATFTSYIEGQIPGAAIINQLNGTAWGQGYCPNEVMAMLGALTAPTIADRKLLALALVISAGTNGVYDTFGGSATAPDTPAPSWLDPAFVILGDDKGQIINLSAMHSSDFTKASTRAKIEKVGNAMGSSFKVAYSTDASAGSVAASTLVTTDYFRTLTKDVTTIPNIINNLGIPSSNLVDEYGNKIHVAQIKSLSPFTMLLYNNCGMASAIPATAP